MTNGKINDPYELNPAAQKQVQREMKGSSSGVLCPKRNPSIGGRCYVCDQTRIWFTKGKAGDKAAKELGYKYMARVNYYLNVVFSSNPDTLVLFEIGKKVGDALIQGIDKKGWIDIAKPKKGEGRELQFMKYKGDQGHAAYSVDPVMDKADYDIPEDVLKSRYNLDNVIQLVESGEANVFKISDLKFDETIRVRLLPPWDNGKGNERVLAYIYRHWEGVTEDHVNGIVPFTEDLAAPYKPTNSGTEATSAGEPTQNTRRHKPCFGSVDFFDPKDKECIACNEFDYCSEVVADNAVDDDDIPF